jgi:hypothetical protein
VFISFWKLLYLKHMTVSAVVLLWWNQQWIMPPPLFVGSLSSMVSFCLLTLDSCRSSCSSVMCLLLHCASPLHVILYHLLVLPAAAIFLYFFGFLAAYDIFVVTSVATSLVRVLTVLPRGDVRVTALTSPRWKDGCYLLLIVSVQNALSIGGNWHLAILKVNAIYEASEQHQLIIVVLLCSCTC